MSNASQLLDFLIALGTDAEALRRFQQDPRKAMSAAGLSAKDQKALTQGDQRLLKAVITAANPHEEQFRVNCPIPGHGEHHGGPPIHSPLRRPKQGKPATPPAIMAPLPKPKPKTTARPKTKPKPKPKSKPKSK